MIQSLYGIPWAILPQKLEAINAIIERGVRGERGFTGQDSGQKSRASYMSVDDAGIATIRIHGTVGRRMSVLQYLLGGVPTEILLSDVNRALSDPQVKGILLYIDSPGGTVDGTKELADRIYDGRSQKPVFSFAEGEMASAAYWLGSSAHKVFAERTAIVGSIGVVAAHYDFSGFDEKLGVKRTYIYNGKYKRIANDAEPLSDEGRAYLQGIVDDYYGIFVEDVERNRETLSQKDILGMESKVYIADKALKERLIDGTGTYAGIYNQLKAEINGQGNRWAGARSTSKSTAVSPRSPHPVTAKKKDFEHLVDDYQKGHQCSRGTAISAIAKAYPHERAAYLEKYDVEERCRMEFKRDPDLQGEYGTVEAFTAYVKAEGKGNIKHIKKGGIKKMTTQSIHSIMGKTFEDLVAEYARANGCSKAEAISHVAKNFPEAHVDYLERCNAAEQWKQEFKQDPSLREEYGSVEAYVAFRQAEAAGRAKIAGSKALSAE